VGLDGVGAAPARGHAGSQGCRPPRLANVRRARLGGEEGRGDEHPHVPRRVLGSLVGENAGIAGCSSWRPPMAPVAVR
jgi:hypothetical protein